MTRMDLRAPGPEMVDAIRRVLPFGWYVEAWDKRSSSGQPAELNLTLRAPNDPDPVGNPVDGHPEPPGGDPDPLTIPAPTPDPVTPRGNGHRRWTDEDLDAFEQTADGRWDLVGERVDEIERAHESLRDFVGGILAAGSLAPCTICGAIVPTRAAATTHKAWHVALERSIDEDRAKARERFTVLEADSHPPVLMIECDVCHALVPGEKPMVEHRALHGRVTELERYDAVTLRLEAIEIALGIIIPCDGKTRPPSIPSRLASVETTCDTVKGLPTRVQRLDGGQTTIDESTGTVGGEVGNLARRLRRLDGGVTDDGTMLGGAVGWLRDRLTDRTNP